MNKDSYQVTLSLADGEIGVQAYDHPSCLFTFSDSRGRSVAIYMNEEELRQLRNQLDIILEKRWL